MTQTNPYHIPGPIKKTILQKLQKIEAQHNVTIIYACESGSRAWGFSSTNSDYDVRFLYIHTKDWYLSVDVERRRDVIELPIEEELDINGWDVRKALWLLRKSNPTLMEWLQSPVTYHQKPEAVDKIREIIPIYYSEKACFYHYLHMALGNFREYLQGEEVWIKKYFYVLRPVLALQWIEQENGPVPMKFEAMVNRLIPGGRLRKDIEKLLAAKREGKELQTGLRVDSISEFLEQQLERLQQKKPAKEPKTSMVPANNVFRSLLNEHKAR